MLRQQFTIIVLLSIQCLLLNSISSQLLNADGGQSVDLSAFFKKEEKEDKSWPPPQEFAKVDVTIMGKKIEGPATSMEPDLTKMKPKKLKKILDDHFDVEWVAIQKPPALNITEKTVSQYIIDPVLAAEVENLNMTMLDTFGKPIHYDVKTLYHFKMWLLRQSSCPIKYFWDDLGPLFWPRWIKRGTCSISHLCTWPPGQICRKSSEKTLKLLRWVCVKKHGAIDSKTDPRFKKRKRSARKNRKRKRRDRFGKRFKRNRKSNKKRRRSGKEGWEKRGKVRKERRRRRLIMRFSETIGRYFCYWMQIDYTVTDSCSCKCY